jgi:hypothetical protein
MPESCVPRVRAGTASNCEPEKTADIQWFTLDRLPPDLTMTARNAIRAYTRQWAETHRGDAIILVSP